MFGWYIEFGFKQSVVDPALFYYQDGEEWIVLLSYSDDSAYFTSTEVIREKFEKAMCKSFSVSSIGSYELG